MLWFLKGISIELLLERALHVEEELGVDCALIMAWFDYVCMYIILSHMPTIYSLDNE